MKIILYILGVIIIIIGVFFLWDASSSNELSMGIFVGLISVGIGVLLIWLGSRQKPAAERADSDVTLNIDLPGNVELDKLQCQNCGGALTTKDVKMVAGAPVVDCPYCGTTYQLKEDPKW